jgi:hypothetical protein
MFPAQILLTSGKDTRSKANYMSKRLIHGWKGRRDAQFSEGWCCLQLKNYRSHRMIGCSTPKGSSSFTWSAKL